jgi:hypothetical protein
MANMMNTSAFFNHNNSEQTEARKVKYLVFNHNDIRYNIPQQALW